MATWNGAASDLIRTYPRSVSAIPGWVRSSKRDLSVMRQAGQALTHDVGSLEDGELKVNVLPLPTSLAEELSAVVELRQAVARVDRTAQKAAQAHLQAAAAQRQDAARVFIDYMSTRGVDAAVIAQLQALVQS
jgi:hypothetical protein